MQVVMEKRNGAEISFKIEIPREGIEEELSRAFRKLVKKAKAPGFRRGKIPRKIFEKRFGKQIIQEEAIKELYPKIYRRIVSEHQLVPIMTPKFQIVEFSEDKPLILRVNLVTRPEVELGNYKGVKAEAEKVNISEDEVTTALKQIQRQKADYVSVGDKRGARKGDWLIMDWQAFYKGKRLPEKRGKNEGFQLGSSLYPSAFSEGLIGLKTGIRKRLEVEFPSQHPQQDFAGKRITFDIEVKDIKEEILPPIDDEFARKFKSDDIESLRKHIKEELRRTKEDWGRKKIGDEIVKRVVTDARMELPLSLKREKVKERIEELKRNLKKRGHSLESYLKERGLSEEKFREEVSLRVREQLRTFFVLEVIANRENIQVDEEELEERFKSIMRRDSNRPLDEEKLGSLREQMRAEKVIEFLYEEAEIS